RPTTARRTVATGPRSRRRERNPGGPAARAPPRRARPAAPRSLAPRAVAARAAVPGGGTTRNGNDADGNVAYNRPMSGGEHVPPEPKRAITMEWVETTGRTIAEALDAALDELGVDEDDVEYEVLEQPKTGFLGRLGSSEGRS